MNCRICGQLFNPNKKENSASAHGSCLDKEEEKDRKKTMKSFSDFLSGRFK